MKENIQRVPKSETHTQGNLNFRSEEEIKNSMLAKFRTGKMNEFDEEERNAYENQKKWEEDTNDDNPYKH